QEVAEHFLTRPIDRVLVPGKKDPIEIIEVLGDANYQLSEGEQYFCQGIEAYRERDFATAGQFFGKGAQTDPPCRVFLARCRRFMEAPPKPDWDGVWMWEQRNLVRP
ncbi:hypothetical protein MYX65_12775, partial [Acidobacteria bacterium AH-259-L09]|nr:hypothetical protein [Acidobacteria bacterium AH-259-L09]